VTIDERIEFLMQSIESHDRQIGELTHQIGELVRVTNRDAENIRALARIAEAHERRIGDLEGPA
jgi:4-hydroxy-3-methylbut-2-en-1-yl diphosphate synthase IspG/GcpE